MQENILAQGATSSRLSLDKVIFSILLFVVFLVPVFFVPLSFISAQFGTSLLFSLGVIVSALLYIVMVLSSGHINLPTRTRYVLGFLVFPPFTYFLAGVANGFSWNSFFGYTFDIGTIGFIITGFVFIFLVSSVFRGKERIFYSYFAFLVSSIIVAVFLLLRLFLGADFLSFGIFNSIVSTTIGSWNNVGIFFGVGVLLSLLTFQMVNLNTFMRVLISIALLVSLFFLTLVNFSIIWMILTVCSFLFTLYIVFTREESVPNSFIRKFLKIPIYPTLVFLISLAFVIFGSEIGTYVTSKFNIANVEIRPSLSATYEIARNTINQSPVFGSGPNTFINQWLVWKPNDLLSTIYWNLDFTNGIGLIPTFAVTTGLLGLLSWLLFLGFYLYLGFKSLFASVEDKFLKYLIVSSFFISLYLWIMNFYYIPSAVIFILTLFFTGLFFAGIYTSRIVETSNRFFSGSPKTGFLVSLILVAIFIGEAFMGYGLFKNSKSLWYFQKSSYALNTEGNADLSEEYMNKAIELVPHDIYYRALSEIELVKLNAVANLDPKKVSSGEIQKKFGDVLVNAIKAGQAAKDADPNNYLNWISLGRVYETVSPPSLKIEGAYESSELTYIEAFRRSPKNPAILVILSRLSASQNNLQKAREYAIDALRLKNNYLDAYFTLSQIEVASGNITGAINAVTASSVIDPTNPAIFFQLGLLKYNLQDWKGSIEALEKAVSIAKDYANAKYFLGLSYEATGQHEKAIKEFTDLSITNPDNNDVKVILQNLKEGKPLFTSAENTKPEKSKNLPVKESGE